MGWMFDASPPAHLVAPGDVRVGMGVGVGVGGCGCGCVGGVGCRLRITGILGLQMCKGACVHASARERVHTHTHLVVTSEANQFISHGLKQKQGVFR